METSKKSFVAYSDWQEIFKELPDEQAGKLIKHIFSYVNGENPETEDVLIKVVFLQIKQTLKRDLKKWEEQLEQRRLAGKASAEKRNPTTVDDRSTKSNDRSTKRNERARKATDSVSVIDSVIVSEEDFLKAKNYLLNLFNKKYVTDENVNLLIKLKSLYEPKELDEAIKWAVNDDFWKPNFLSPAKLIKKNDDGVTFIDVFIAKSKQAKQQNQKPKQQFKPEIASYHVIQ